MSIDITTLALAKEYTNRMVGSGGTGGGVNGKDGITPHIGDNGNWFIGTVDTGISAQGPAGENGVTPHIGTNGNWYIGSANTGVSAKGAKGDNGLDGNGIKSAILNSDYTLTLTFDDGTTYTTPSIRGATGSSGKDGPAGAAGKDGTDGVGIASIEQTATSTADGGNNVFTVTLTNGTTATFTVKNGSKGSTGKDGSNGVDGGHYTPVVTQPTTDTMQISFAPSKSDMPAVNPVTVNLPVSENSGQNPPQDGEDGATFTPAVSADGTLSWTNDKGLENPAPVNIKGPQGERGLTGETGPQGEKGPKGDTGATGPAGADGAKGDKGDKGDAGANGTSVTVKSVSESAADGGSNVVTFSDGKTVTIKNGSKGSTGAAGKDGSDGVPGVPGVDGADGYTPVRGVDYWTPDDIAAMDAKLAQMLAERAQLRPEPAESLEWLKANGDTSKLYVLMDKSSEHYGYIYGWYMTEVESGPAYTNVLPLAINADGTPYVGNNGEKGYKTGYRLNSSRVESAATGRCCTGFIPVKSTDTVRVKNIFKPADGSSNGYVHFYGSDFAAKTGMVYEGNKANGFYLFTGDIVAFVPAEIGTTIGSGSTNASDETAYMRISTGIIDDTSIITINEEIVEGGGTTTEYAWANTGISTDCGPRVTALEKQTAQNTADIANLKNGVASTTHIKDWDKPIYDANIPVSQLPVEKAAMTNAAQTPADIYARYDALMAKHPHYITKTDLGLCSDGVNHVYRYDFREPDSRHTSGYPWSETKPKAIIVSGIHFEWSGIYGLYYALEEIAENPDLYALRRNTHLIVVPCVNPYATIANNYQSGLPTPNSQGVRNANGVEIHRNFEVGWVLTEEGTTHYGGPAPLSEVETRYVDTIMRENADAALFLTCHNFGDKNFNFIWPSTATAYMCNMGYRLIDKLSRAWLDKYADELVGLEEYRTDDIPAWDNRLGFAHISQTPGTETRQGTKYNIQSANVEINGRFWVHGTEASPEPSMSAFTMSRGAEVYINFLLTVFGCYDPKDKALHAPAEV